MGKLQLPRSDHQRAGRDRGSVESSFLDPPDSRLSASRRVRRGGVAVGRRQAQNPSSCRPADRVWCLSPHGGAVCADAPAWDRARTHGCVAPRRRNGGDAHDLGSDGICGNCPRQALPRLHPRHNRFDVRVRGMERDGSPPD